MKFSSARGFARSRGSLVAVLALAATLGLAGCEGDSGGPSGPGDTGGNGGQTGPTGPTGPSDVPITLGGDVKDVGTGAGLTAQQIADIGTLVATIDTATVTDSKPVIEITVQTTHGGNVLGLAASTLRLGIAKLIPAGSGLPSRWQSYVNQAGTPSIPNPVLTSAVQATTETGAAGGWTDLGAGRYRYASAVDLSTVTAPIAVPYEPNRTHRLSIALDLSGDARALAPDNPYLDFVPSGGSAGSKKIAATQKCASCHVRFAEHGGPRRSVEYCVVCHNPGTIDPDSGESVDLAYMAHSIHRGGDRAQPYVVYGRNGTLFDTSGVTYPQPISFCETCHEQSPEAPQGDDWNVSVTASACGGCHVAGLQKTGPDPQTGRYAYSFKHPAIPSLPPDFVVQDGDCLGCHGPGKAETLAVHKQDEARKEIENGSLFTYEILNIENAAVGQSPTVTFQILDADGAPIDVKTITTGRLRLHFAWSTQDFHNVADVAGGQYAVDRGEAIEADLIADMASVVANDDGTFSYTLSQALPAGFADATLGTGLMVVLNGRRQMPDGSEAHPESAFRFSGGARTQLVAQEKCEACHKRVRAHGGSRAGDPLICTVCHNSSVGGTWLDQNNNPENLGALALGSLIHRAHKGVEETYPQRLERCEGCHVEGTFNLARTAALPLTVDANTTLEEGAEALSWQDDKADSATAGTCKGCHDSSEAIAHMEEQGGWFAQPKTLTPSSSSEGCAVCHGAGQTFDTKVEHCSRLPFGQCTTQ